MRRRPVIAGVVVLCAGVVVWLVWGSAPPPTPPPAPQPPAAPPADAELPAVHGRVVDGAGRPIPGATVRCDDTAVQSDPVGAFVCPMWDEGSHTLLAHAKGFADLRRTGHAALRLDLAAPGARGPHRLVLRRPGRVRGHVVRGATPVAGAQVSVTYRVARGLARDLPPFRIDRLATTDARGAFVLEGLPAGRLQVHAVGPDRAAGASAPLDLQPAAERTLILRLQASASVSVTVRSRGGAPLRARVTLRRADTVLPLRAVADARGAARFDGVPADRWTLSASAPGHADSADLPVDVRPHGALSLTLRLQPLSGVSGLVVDPAGEPVVAAGVLLRCASGTRRVQSKLAGDFRWAEPTQPCEAVAVHPSYGPSPETSVTPGEPARLQLRPGGRVSGRALDASGRPVPGALVRIGPRDVGKLDPLGPPHLQPLHAQPDGRFRSGPLRPGTYTLAGSAPGHGPGVTRGVVVRGGRDTTADVRLDGGGWVVGTVRDPLGDPLEGAQVRLLGRDWQASARSHAGGAFRVGPAPGGTYLLLARSATNLPARVADLQVPDRGELRQDLRLRAVDRAQTQVVRAVGASIRETPAGLTFVEVRAGSPAALAGVQVGDRITTVDFQRADQLGVAGTAKAFEGASVQVTAEVVGPDGHARSVYLTPAGPEPAGQP